MLYRKMPKNGDELSILGFGCMRLPMKEDGSIDEDRATRQVRYAIDHGVNYVDTAWPYHMEQSEPFLGRALADGYREKVKLATKLPSWLIKSREDMDKFLDAQLKKLNIDHIDYYLIHALVGDLWDYIEKLGIADFLDKARADGRIINAGFSFHGSGDEFKRIVDAYDWDFCQIQYNFLDEKNQAGTEGLEYAASKGLGVIIMEPLRGGYLANPVPPAVQEIWDEASTKRTAAEWALLWVWNHPEVTVVLSGMNEETHIEENLAVADKAYPNSLTEAEIQLVKKVERKYRELMKAGCTGCRYCMPCPEGVNIPLCFETYNTLYMSGNADETKFMYAARLGGVLSGGEPEFASLCVQCGECLEKCPQHLDIPTILESVVEELEGSDLEERVAIAKQIFKK
ncbi:MULTISPECIES: aldo/keto reductase [Methanosarcina]|jgi:predicted aldo/keto reductase-like oxidoreductase|uniref:Aldo/keto reductase n=5 Tax=Methanosarcina mazei TaxID=2209 RepID=A0A0F8Q4B5_METMZ|nr:MULTISPECIES: aldo/keto reductase [Methanosarcina]AAM31311.1 oxidoreductase, ALDO/KETO reductase family [Methanosarcina mazei Go1]AGF97039.1 Aldo/keto reductase [Methanosarcina mazei Tuc01]AKB66250.1 Aldo/keto reductase [Methanosarcina mazei S-6]AKB72964.1 Aldo/keto reductase [Methanosarcina mazei C16]KKF99199.1 aldo/keto reductase [Methanosarcina mazei]